MVNVEIFCVNTFTVVVVLITNLHCIAAELRHITIVLYLHLHPSSARWYQNLQQKQNGGQSWQDEL
jgi:hypothetical protein